MSIFLPILAVVLRDEPNHSEREFLASKKPANSFESWSKNNPSNSKSRCLYQVGLVYSVEIILDDSDFR